MSNPDNLHLDPNSRRRANFLRGIDIGTMVGLEIGALNRPTVSKADGSIYYVDFASTAELRRLYEKEPTVRESDIVDVDFIWSGARTLSEASSGLAFDYVLASHVIEHIPNPLSWMIQIAESLTPGGVLSLIVPDKRFTFDRPKPLTTIGQVVGAYVENPERPTSTQVFTHLAHHAVIDLARAWEDPDGEVEFPLVHTTQEALQMAQNVWNSKQYFDVHCWMFTPRSFLDLLEELSRLNVFPFLLSNFTESQYGEIDFFASLEKMDANLVGQTRLEHQLKAIGQARSKISSR